jgi:hypothetical protein
MTPKTTALLLSPIGLVLLSATRLFIISDYNTTTAVTVASSGGYVNTLLGSTVPLVPIFLPYVALILLLYRQFFLSIAAFLFTAFITPTPLTVPVTRRLLGADKRHLFSLLSEYRYLTVAIALLVLLIAWIYSSKLVEALSVIAAIVVVLGVLITPYGESFVLPEPLRLAGYTEHRIVSWLSGYTFISIAIGVVIFVGLSISANSLSGFIVTAIAVVGAVTLTPYVYNIYPIPREAGYYYATVMHNPWLPAERLTLSSSLAYYGYALSTSDGWFTVLLVNGRTIVYIPADKVVSRAICQPQLQDQPKQYPPLVSLFYTPPPHIPACPDRDVVSIRTSFLSDGQSLNSISYLVHAAPWQIITTTNAYQGHRLSLRLYDYEAARNWNAPTPAGQHFWYYPPIPDYRD